MMRLEKMLEEVLKSDTIKPSFKEVHVLLALLIFKELKEANKYIGRYKLMKELDMTEGKVKSMLKRMKNLNLIRTESRISGHEITDEGLTILKELLGKINMPKLPKFDFKSLVVGDSGYYCIVKNGKKNLSSGIEQRDEVIKIGGIGATCLVLDADYKFKFPNEDNPVDIKIGELDGESVKIDDVIVIGTGHNKYKARLATLSAALSLTEILKKKIRD